MSLDLTHLSDEGSEITEKIGGMEFHFSELLIEGMSRLQDWIKKNTPHPIEAIKPHLEGLGVDERRALLESARIEAMQWPPIVGTGAGAKALLGSELGQVETMWEGLKVHYPEATRDDAFKIFRVFNRENTAEKARIRQRRMALQSRVASLGEHEAAEAVAEIGRMVRVERSESPRVLRLFATLFGNPGMAEAYLEEIGDGPKAQAPAAGRIDGTSSYAGASVN